MMAVIFEVQPAPGQQDAYLGAAAALRPLLEQIDGFISIERFESLSEPGKLLSLSFWRDEAAVARWRQMDAHRSTQQAGRPTLRPAAPTPSHRAAAGLNGQLVKRTPQPAERIG